VREIDLYDCGTSAQIAGSPGGRFTGIFEDVNTKLGGK
jgi:hypothetical protein